MSVLTPDEQKNYLEQTMIAMQDQFKLDEWRADAEIIKTIAQSMDQKRNLNADAVGDLADDIWDTWSKIDYGDAKRLAEYVFRFSDIKGHFTQSRDGVFYQDDVENPDDLVIKAMADGEEVVASFKVNERSDKIKVYHNVYSYTRYYYSMQGYTQYQFTDETTVSVYLPTSVTFSFSKGNRTLASVDLTLQVNTQTNVFNPKTDSFNLMTYVSCSEYRVNVNQVALNTPNVTCSVSVNKKSGQKILSTEASADFILSNNVDGIDDLHKENGIEGGSATASVELMDRVTIKGVIKDGKKCVDLMDALNRNNKDAITFRSLLSDLNDEFDLLVYYKGSGDIQASVKFDMKLYSYSYSYSSWNYSTQRFELVTYSNEYWDYIPVIVFPDGSNYALDAYFDEDSFRKGIDDGKMMIDSIMDWFGDVDVFLGRQ